MATSTAERIADSDDEASTTRVDDLIQRGRGQGHLSLAELRAAFEQAGITPAEGRSIIRELARPACGWLTSWAEDQAGLQEPPGTLRARHGTGRQGA